MKKSVITLLLMVIALLMFACTAPGSTGSEGQSSESGESASPYQLLIASSDVTVVDNRVALTFWDGPARFTAGEKVTVAIYLVDAEGAAGDKLWEGEATPFDMSGVEYWVVYPEFALAGNYGIQTFLTTENNEQYENRALLTVKADAAAPAKGEPVPPTDTLTLDDVDSVEELSSAGPYVEDFYRLSLEEATQNGKVSVISFATPGHCTSALCAPILLTMSNVYDKMPDSDINWLHIEIWRDFESEYLEPAVTDWNLPSEPWIFILDTDGTVAARLDGPVSVEELEQTILEVENG